MTKVRFGTIVLIVLVGLAFLLPMLSPYNPTEMSFGQALQAPSREHPFGTDQFGRDILVRLAHGLRTSLLYAITAVSCAAFLGTALGTLAGHYGGWTDTLLMRPLEVLMAFPIVLLAITVIAALGTGTTALMIAVIAVYTPIIARVARAAVVKIRPQEYVQAAEALGVPQHRIITRHVLPNSLGPIMTQCTVLLGLAILLEAGLSFLGLGVQPPAPSLGLMLAEGREFMSGHVWVVAYPGLAIVLSVMAFNLIGSELGMRWGS
jgi:peptide/nickel transport system permease protein